MAPLLDRNSLLQNFVACSRAMMAVVGLVDLYARARTPVLLVGATGTGKTTLAELLHAFSGRPGRLNAHTAGEFDPGLERSQIFGHERGAFTGAVVRLAGVLEDAGEGTLLLDDFHHLPTSTQATLLRALDRWAFRRLGGSRDLPVQCRMIIGLGESPETLVERKALLAELRFRLGYSVITLPPLDARREDIPDLAAHFLQRCPWETALPGPSALGPGLPELLQTATWPGNVRQLGMAIREGYVRAQGAPLLQVEHVAEVVSLPVRFRRRGSSTTNTHAIQKALAATHGDASAAAKLLGTARSTVYRYRAQERRGLAGAASWSDSGSPKDKPDAFRAPFAPTEPPELPPPVVSAYPTAGALKPRCRSDSRPRTGESDKSAIVGA